MKGDQKKKRDSDARYLSFTLLQTMEQPRVGKVPWSSVSTMPWLKV